MNIPSSTTTQNWLSGFQDFLLSTAIQNWLSILLALVAVIATVMPYLLQRRQNKDYIKKSKLLLKRDVDFIYEQIKNTIKYDMHDKHYSILANQESIILMKGIIDKLYLNYCDFLVLFDKKEDQNYIQLKKALENLIKLMDVHGKGKGTSLNITDQAQQIYDLKNSIFNSIVY